MSLVGSAHERNPHLPLLPMSGRVQDRVIVVTGAARGQGAAEVAALHAEGAVVIATDVESVASDVPDRVHPRRLDVTAPADWRTLAEWADETFGRVDGLINNAGTTSRVPLTRVNAVHPGYIETPMTASAPAGFRHANEALTPLGRVGMAEEVAALMVFLMSEESSYLSGADIPVDGGFSSCASGKVRFDAVRP